MWSLCNDKTWATEIKSFRGVFRFFDDMTSRVVTALKFSSSKLSFEQRALNQAKLTLKLVESKT